MRHFITISFETDGELSDENGTTAPEDDGAPLFIGYYDANGDQRFQTTAPWPVIWYQIETGRLVVWLEFERREAIRKGANPRVNALRAWKKIRAGAVELLAAYEAGNLNESQPASTMEALPKSIDEWIADIDRVISDWKGY
jgi:hypothetical protein